jgi:hypothetical protein
MKTLMNVRKLSTAFVTICAAVQPALSKPMEAPTLEEAARSNVVVIAQYVDYKPFLEPVTYFDGVMGHYVVEKVLKGKRPRDKHINVAYAFHDGSACLADKNWKFSDAVMPKKESSWILFLQEPNWKSSTTENAYSTYRGDFGRMPANAANIEKVQKLLSASHN